MSRSYTAPSMVIAPNVLRLMLGFILYLTSPLAAHAAGADGLAPDGAATEC